MQWSCKDEWDGVTTAPLQCERCGRDAECPVLGEFFGALPIWSSGMGVVFDRAPKFVKAVTPEVIECRGCRVQYSKWGGVKGVGNVR